MALKELKILNSLSGKKEVFKPQNPAEVKIYGCGPTVYGYTHVGNARAALVFDLVVRTLEYFNYRVNFVRNFTDVDDKIIATAIKEKKDAQEVSEFYIRAYLNDLEILKTRKPDHSPKVTETISEIIVFIQGLIDGGLAYTLKTDLGNDVYYAVENFKGYGKLSHRNLEDIKSGSRAEVEEHKKHPADFALWKAAKKGEPSWPSPWGDGRPGWHIECSAMIQKIFQGPLDIHMGGIDLIFPHHENEIAQSEGLCKKPLAQYWIHNGLLEFGHEKMSKSLGNIVRTKDFLENHHPEVLRLLFFQQHYRSPLDFSDENIARAEALLERLYISLEKSQTSSSAATGVSPILQKMEDTMADDFNSAKALGELLSAVRNSFRTNQAEDWAALMPGLNLLQKILGLLNENPKTFLQENRKRKLRRWGITEEISTKIDEQMKAREVFRAQKNFEKSDEVRKTLESQGILVMDGPDGSSWSMKGK